MDPRFGDLVISTQYMDEDGFVRSVPMRRSLDGNGLIDIAMRPILDPRRARRERMEHYMEDHYFPGFPGANPVLMPVPMGSNFPGGGMGWIPRGGYGGLGSNPMLGQGVGLSINQQVCCSSGACSSAAAGAYRRGYGAGTHSPMSCRHTMEYGNCHGCQRGW